MNTIYTLRSIFSAGRLCCIIVILALVAGCGKGFFSLPEFFSSSERSGSATGNPSQVKADIVRTARAQIGTPYRSGGAAPGGFDCSGLVQWAYRQHGITVPRTTAQQIHAGVRIKKNELQAGDIIVFRTSSGLHTGIYTGKGTFIHSPRTGAYVREERLHTDYWTRAYREARRIL